MRAAVSLAAAIAISLGLFVFMQALISGNPGQPGRTGPTPALDFIHVEREELTQVRERRKPPKPVPPRRLPPAPRVTSAPPERPALRRLDLEMPRIAVAPTAARGPFLGPPGGASAADGDIVPIVRIEPQYPREALLDGIEGWVKVEFTINADGTVSDPRVLEAQPRRIFDRSAMRAILRWKFKPRILDGEPIERRATQVIEYKLDPGDA